MKVCAGIACLCGKFLVAAVLVSIASPAEAEWVTRSIATANLPRAIGVNPVTNKIYVAQEGANSVLVVTALTGVSSTVAVQNAPDAIAVDPSADRIYVANQASASVSVIDGTTDGVITTIPVGGDPYAIAVNPITHRIYVTNRTSNSVSVIEGATNAVVQTIAVGGSPQSIAVNPITNKIYVGNHDTNNVTVIDGGDGTTTTVTVGTTPYAVAVNPSTNYVYVANYQSANVTRIDGTTNAKVNIATGSGPYALAVNPFTNRIYVACVASQRVTVINGATNGTTTVTTGTNPIAVAINFATNRVYVPCLGSTTMTIIDGATNGATALTIGSRGLSAAVNAWTGRAYVALNSAPGPNLVEVDCSTNTASAVATGQGPASVAVNRSTRRAYTANRDAGSVTEVDLVTMLPAATIAVGAGPVAILVDEFRNRIFTADAGANRVSRIDGATRAVTSVAVSPEPQALALDERSGVVYAACRGDAVVRIDGATLGTITIGMGPGANPVAVAVNPVTQACYAANRGTNTVARIEWDGTLSNLLCVGASPAALAVHAAGNQIFVANSLGSSVDVIDGATDESITVPTLAGPVALAVDPERARLFVADSVAQALSIVSIGDLSVTDVSLAMSPRTLAMNRWTGRLYAGGPGSSVLKSVDLGSLAVLTLTSTSGVGTIATDDANGLAIVGHAGGAQVDVVRERLSSALPLTSAIQAIANDEAAPSPQTFTGTSTSTRSPSNAGIVAQYLVVDSPAKRWTAASVTSGYGTPNAAWSAAGVDPGPPGTHILFSAAFDATSATADNSSQCQASIFVGTPAAYLFRTRTDAPSDLPPIDPAQVLGTVTAVVSPYGEEPFVASLNNAWVSLVQDGQQVPAQFPLTTVGGGFVIPAYFHCGDRLLSHLANDTLKVKVHERPDPDCTDEECISTIRDVSTSQYLMYWPENDASSAFYLINRLIREYWEKRLGVYPELTLVEVTDRSEDLRRQGGGATQSLNNGSAGRIFLAPGYESFDDVVAHEFAHRMVIKQIRGTLSEPCRNPSTSESRGLDEGLADYFAAAYHGDPQIAEGLNGNQDPIRNLANTRQYRWCSSDPDQNGGYPGSVILSGALWDLRGVLDDTHDEDVVDRWVYDAIADLEPLSCEERTYRAFRDRLRARLLEGTNVAALVNASFGAHGIVDSPADVCVPRPIVQQIQRVVDQIGQHVSLAWSAVTGTTFYKVFMRPFGTWGTGLGEGELVADSLTATEYVHTEPDTSLLLAFVIVPYDAEGNPGPSSLETPAVTAAPPPVSTITQGLSLSIAPNPSRGETAFHFGFSRECPGDLLVFDIAGRCVRTLRPEAGSEGAWIANWDGTNQKGSAVPAGVYLVRSTSTKGIVGRLVIVR